MTATDEALMRREMEIHAHEESMKNRDRDLETRERTVAVELEKLEKERTEVKDLWDKVENSKKGLAAMVDEKTIAELERRKQELDSLYLKLADREESVRKDEHHLEEEWTRLHSIEEELSDLALVLKTKETDIKKFDGSAPDGH